LAESKPESIDWLDKLATLTAERDKNPSVKIAELAKTLDISEGQVSNYSAIQKCFDKAALEKVRQAAQANPPHRLSFKSARALANLNGQVDDLSGSLQEALDVIYARHLLTKQIEALVEWMVSGKPAKDFDPNNQSTAPSSRSAANDEEKDDESQTETAEDAEDMGEESEEETPSPAPVRSKPVPKTIGQKAGDKVARTIDGLGGLKAKNPEDQPALSTLKPEKKLGGWDLRSVALGFATACLLMAVWHFRNSLPDQVTASAPKVMEAIPTVVLIPTPEPTVKVETPKVSAHPHKALTKHATTSVTPSNLVKTVPSPALNHVLSPEVQARIAKDTDFAVEFVNRVYGLGFRNVDDRDYFKSWLTPSYAPEFFANYIANSKITEIQAKKWTESLKDAKAKLLRADETSDDFLITGTVLTKCELNTRNPIFTYRPVTVEIHLTHSLNMTEIVSQVREVSSH